MWRQRQSAAWVAALRSPTSDTTILMRTMKLTVHRVLSCQSHNTCVTEHEKYAKGATKPGGHAANGFFSTDAAGAAAVSPAVDGGDAVVGAKYLSSRPPWKCRWAQLLGILPAEPHTGRFTP